MTAFDQYQRYNNAAIAVNRFRTSDKNFRILEVGANEHKNLEKFLPKDNIMYLDIKLPEHLLHDSQYILGDATDMDFEDDAYDIVIALDVFEHIPPEKRKQFIDELQRVSKEFFLITAPFESPHVVRSEMMANAVYKGAFGEDYIWLQEHRDNGLPKIDELEQYLQSQPGVSYKIIGHGNLDIWEKMMKIHFCAAYNPKLHIYRDEMDEFYNANIFDWDYCDQSYRKIVIASKNNNMNMLDIDFSKKTIPAQQFKELEQREQDFYHLVSLLHAEPVSHINHVDDEIKLYINTGEGYNEDDTIGYRLNSSNMLRTYHFELMAYESIHSIRLDPSNYSGIYKITNIQLTDSENASVLYSLDGNFEIELDETYIFGQDDPYISLHLQEPAKLVQLSLEICTVSSDLTTIANEFKKVFEFKKNKRHEIKQNFKQLKESYDQLVVVRQNESMQHEQQVLELEKKLEASKQTLAHYQADFAKQMKDCNEEKVALLQELNGVYNSRKWKSLLVAGKFLGKR